MSANDTGKLGEAPPPGSDLAAIRAYLTEGYGLPDGYYVRRVVRYGGRDGTGLAVFIATPGDGQDLRISYEREIDCTNPVKLRARAAADTKGLTRGTLISGPKAALAMYEALCSLSDHFEAADQHGQTWEWVQQLRRVAAQTRGMPDEYWALRRLQDHPYTKALVQDPPLGDNGKPHRPVPLLLVANDGAEYVTARHMAVFCRYDLGVEDAGSDDRILTRLSEIGGRRHWTGTVWDRPGRDRQDKVRLVLYQLPEEEAPDDPE